MLIQIREDWIVSISLIQSASRRDGCTWVELDGVFQILADPDKEVWNRLLAACVKAGDAEPLD